MNRLSSFWARVLGPIDPSSVGVRTAFGRVTARRKPPLRRWFRDEKRGDYYRNLPLIMDEQREVMTWRNTMHKFAVLDSLHAEWNQVWREGLMRKDELGPDDMLATPAPFREMYPDRPGLWCLDDPKYGGDGQ